MTRRMLSVPEVASRFEVTSQTVRNWIASGRLPAIQMTRRGRFRISTSALRAFEHDAGNLATRRRPMAPRAINAELARVVGAIVDSVHPQAIFLFGSRARGDFKPDSDVDLAIIAADGSERRRVAKKAYESIATVRDRSVGVDVVVLTPKIIAAERDLVGSLARAVVREGVPVYGIATLA